MTSRSIRFTLDGSAIELYVAPGRSALDVLRDDLGRTSVKRGCAPEGVCGCCTVLLDGRPRATCTLEATRLEGRTVTTVDGLDPADRDLLVEAFTRGGGVQCGYCTPGILLSVQALLARDPDPDEAAVARALGRHLCRCTGWHGIFRSVRLAAALRRLRGTGAPPGPDPLREVDRRRTRERALGQRPFIGDRAPAGLLHGALVWSPRPRCVVVAVDTAEARAMPGVRAVVVAEDFPGPRDTGLLVPDWPPLVGRGEEAQGVGDVLCAVAAETPEQARAAAARVRVEVEELPPVLDPEAAAADPAQVLATSRIRRGDVDGALARSAVVVEETFHTAWVDHAFLEPEAALAEPLPGGGVRVLSCGQGVFSDREQLARLLALPVEQVVVEQGGAGGAFGGREDLNVQPHAALLALQAGRPVRVVLSMAESLRFHPKRHPFRIRYTLGTDAAGLITAIRVRMWGDTGAHASVGPKVLERAAGHSGGPYRIPAVDVEAVTVRTNNPVAGAMRGFGAGQVAFALEGCLDRAAARLGLDPFEIRVRNALREGDPFVTGQVMGAGTGILATLEAARPFYAAARARGRAVGVACGIKNVGLGNGYPETGRIVLEVVAPDRVRIHTGFTEMGQGHDTVLARFAAEATGLPPTAFEVSCSTREPVDVGMTTSSRATVLGGLGVRAAARGLKAALETEGSLEPLVGRRFTGVHAAPETHPPEATVAAPRTHFAYGYATQLAILDASGRLEEVVAVHDVGHVVHPLQCQGQVEGGVVMGIGQALTEELAVTEGWPETRLGRLGLLRARQVPKVTVVLVEHPDPVGPSGAKGVGEIGLVPTPAAIAGALQAFDGAWRTRLPLRDPLAARSLARDTVRPGPADRSGPGHPPGGGSASATGA